MARIAVFKELGGTKLGEGTGVFDSNLKTAAIHVWTDRAGLKVNTSYALKIDGKDYGDATCSAVGVVAPLATFTGVE